MIAGVGTVREFLQQRLEQSNSQRLKRFSGITLVSIAVFSTSSSLATPVTLEASMNSATSSAAITTSYDFNSDLLMGTSIGSDNIDRFNRPNYIDPGKYTIDIFLNGNFQSRKTIDFVSSDKNEVYPCLTDAYLIATGVLPESITLLGNDGTADATRCLPVDWRIKGAAVHFTVSTLRVDVSIPQALMKNLPPGFVDEADLDAGESMLFANYDMNHYRIANYSSTYLGINSGFNIGMWRLRQVGNYSYQGGQAQSTGRWQTISSYAQRSLTALQSELTLGDTYSSGALFSSIGFRGITLRTDDRMRPDSQQGYAPIVRGVALTNARVTIRQGKNELLQATVAPGPFEFKDLHPTSFQGDLQVEVAEADGRISTFTVPFSAVPESIREGTSKYSISLGKITQIEGVSPYFIDGTYQRGLSNSLTANAGLRFGSGYQSALAGIVLGSPVGALGINAIYSAARDANNSRIDGWRTSATYSHTIQPTQTTLALAGYRYSTNGYRDLVDVLGARGANAEGNTWSSSTYQQRNQYVLSIGQGLETYGQLSVSAGVNEYYSGRERDTQYQLSYSNNYKSVSYNIALSRQKSGLLQNNGLGSGAVMANNLDGPATNMVNLSISIPIGSVRNPMYLSSSVTSQTGGNTSYQTSTSGTLDEAKTVSYGLSANVTKQNGSHSTSTSMNVQKQFSVAGIGASYSLGQGYWQAGLNMRGAAVVHAGGITLGPYLGETFGLIEAEGAQGALVRNGMGASVDRFGYAIVPNLIPYRYNEVSLDSQGINSNAELSGVQQQTAPYAGASIKFKFETKIGRAVLIKTTLADGSQLPLGSSVFSEDNINVGMVGQGGKIYARAGNKQGKLTVKWGADNGRHCSVPYNLNDLPKSDEPIVRITAVCETPN